MRETWKEFQQELQDWLMRVSDAAEDDGWIYGAESAKNFFVGLFNWAEDRYLMGANAIHAEDEYFAYLSSDHYLENGYG